MREKAFGVLQRVGRSFMLPIAILPVAGLLLGIGQSFTNPTMLKTYRLERFLGPGTIPNVIFTVMSEAGNIIFANLPIIFALGVAIGMARREKEVAALAAAVAFFIMHASIGALIILNGGAESMLEGATGDVVGITSLQMGVFGGIIVGLGTAALHNRFYKIQLPQMLSFFGGTRFVPIISALVYTGVGILMFFVWPVIQRGIYGIGDLVLRSGYVGTWIYGVTERALIPFGLHHVFYLPFWQTGVGGTMEVAGRTVEGAQNIFFAQLADPSVEHFAVSATRFMSGKFPLMIFGLPGAALAMYKAAKPEKKKTAAGLLLSAALTSMLTGITEPLEFTFLFVAPLLYVIHCILAGLSYMLMHILNVGVGMTFSGGLIDLFLFGILQGNGKTNWFRIVLVGIVYFLVYYLLFGFLIRKFNYMTPGREEGEETKLYMRKDVEARKRGEAGKGAAELGESGAAEGAGRDDRAGRAGSDGADSTFNAGKEGAALRLREELREEERMSMDICLGLGGRDNISDIDCCATRLRCTVEDSSLVDEGLLKDTGASGVIRKGDGVQIIYGPRVTVIKSNLEDYLETVPEELERQYAAAIHAPAREEGERGTIGEKEQEKASSRKGEEIQSTPIATLASPMTGRLLELSQVPDDAFASGMLGDGVAIEPTGGTVTCPEDGVIKFVFPAHHALGFQTKDGMDMLIHVGMDTVKLEGRGFEVFVKTGDSVKRGQKLMELDLDYLRAHAPSLISPVICTELSKNQAIRLLRKGKVKNGEPIFQIVEKAE